MNKNYDIEYEKEQQIKRGIRIKEIRENELRLNKSDLAKKIGISSQFLGVVESGKANLVYRNIKALMDLSGHSSDYILFGLDDEVIKETKEYLKQYSEREILNALVLLKELSSLMKKNT